MHVADFRACLWGCESKLSGGQHLCIPSSYSCLLLCERLQQSGAPAYVVLKIVFISIVSYL